MTGLDLLRVRAAIQSALVNDAARMRRQASGHANMGPRNAEHRASLRAEASFLEGLAHIAGHADPQRLADVLTANRQEAVR